MRPIKTIFIVTAFVLLIACAGNNFDEYNISRLETGVTTREQAEILLGEHYSSIKKGDEDFVSWMYARAGGIVPQVKVLELVFTNNLLTCVRVLSGFDPAVAEQANLETCPGTVKITN